MRDPDADGTFVYGVLTTGVYCRPSCPSRIPNRRNARFFERWEEAEKAGFRPCKRCAPRSRRREQGLSRAVIRACRLIEASAVPPSLGQLAREVGVSPYHFHRTFRRLLGVTPKQYAVQKRFVRVKEGLRGRATVTDAIFDAGYRSSGRFYERASAALGMKPSEFRKKGENLQIRFASARCFLGWVLVAVTSRGVCAVELGDSPGLLESRLRAAFSGAQVLEDEGALGALVERVIGFIEKPKEGLSLPLDIQGTAFQRRVWDALSEVGPGSVVSYWDIAARIGAPKAARAVARACAANPVAVLVPCHRAVRRDGRLGGYRWGAERKRQLLERETRSACGLRRRAR